MATPRLQHEKLRRGLGNRRRRNAADDAAAAARKERRARCGDLRTLHRLSFQVIGQELGVSREQARLDFDAWLAENSSPRQAEVRAEEEPALLDLAQENRIARRMILKRMADASIGQEELLDCVSALAALERSGTRISESRRKLHGADAPEEKSVTHAGPDGGPIPVAATKATLAEILLLAASNEEA